MTDYTLRREFPLKPEQNEAIEFMLQKPYCINALQTRISEKLTQV